jgi:WD40 repeat protein
MSGLFGSAAASSAASTTVGDLKQDVALSDPPSDSISDLSFSPAPNGPDFLAVSSWDNKVRIYEIAQNGQSQGRHAFEHSQPVLGCDFSKVSKCARDMKKEASIGLSRINNMFLNDIGWNKSCLCWCRQERQSL